MEKNAGLFGLELLSLKKQGFIWTFKHRDGKLEFKISQEQENTEKNQWQEVCSDYYGYFSFLITPWNKLYLIYKNHLEQTVCVILSLKGKGKSFEIGFSQGEQITFQKVLYLGKERILLLIFTENLAENRWKIYSFLQEDGTWQEPEIVDSGWGVCPGESAIAIGNEGLVYLVYQVFNQREYQVVYRINKNNFWSEQATILFSPELNFDLSLSIDKEGTPHLVWLRSIQFDTKIMYTTRIKVNYFWTRWYWQKPEIISSSGSNCSSPVIILKEQYPVIYWQVVKGHHISVYCLQVGKKEAAKLIYNFDIRDFSVMLLDLDKYPELVNYDAISKGNTLFLLLAVFVEENEKGELFTEKAIVKELKLSNAKLRKSLKKKDEEHIKAESKWKCREKDLEKEIERLKQSQKVIQKINEELRERLRDKESLKEVEVVEKGFDKVNERRIYPHFPFMRRKS